MNIFYRTKQFYVFNSVSMPPIYGHSVGQTQMLKLRYVYGVTNLPCLDNKMLLYGTGFYINTLLKLTIVK